MRGYLVRIGIDQEYGRWNAPVDPETGEFVYLPITDGPAKQYSPELKRSYREFLRPLELFSAKYPQCNPKQVTLPSELLSSNLHLDPDFEYLTYGDNGDRRGSGIATLQRGDVVVFYSGLRSIVQQPRLIYALIGIVVIDEVVFANSVEPSRRKENAHTRWTSISSVDIVVRGQQHLSGRFDRCIPIGEWRDRAYRVRKDLEEMWGGLSVANGYIQRSAVPPSFQSAERFYKWFRKQNVTLLERNN